MTDIAHIAYTALHEKPELVAGWSSKEQIETDNAMLHNVVEPILANASNFQHVSIPQGTKVYGVHLHPIPIPARERDPRDPHDNFSWTKKTMSERWAPNTASITRHCARNLSPAQHPVR
jgi:hypothetical protein